MRKKTLRLSGGRFRVENRAGRVAACVLLLAAARLTAGETVVLCDSSLQLIRGYGAANILNWRPDMTADQAETAFGTEDGQVGLSILRLRIPSESTPQAFSANVRTARRAVSLGVTLIASPWSPPASMKTNNNVVGGELEESAYPDYADHLHSFVQTMADNGAPIYAVSVQNEPDITVTYESCDWDASQMLKFVKEHGRDVGARLIVPESFNFNRSISDAILNDPEAAANVDIIGGHLYGGGLAPYPLAQRMGKELWMTEYLDTDTTWTKVLATGKQIHDCMNAGMNAYVWWYIVRYYGPILEDGRVSRRGYVMSQWARFVRPGFTRVPAVSGGGTAVYSTAYRGGSRLVIVVVNTRSTAATQTFRVSGGGASGMLFTPYVTTASKNCVRGDGLSAADGAFTATLEPSSVTTFTADLNTGVNGPSGPPGGMRLNPNFPNPFNPRTRITFTVPRAAPVSLKVFDLTGAETAVLFDGPCAPGDHEVVFDASGLASGTYLLRMASGNAVQTRRMTLLR
ncbi:MAG: T9SS type A sorting domain-containing protein [bacterium]|nr:T9SS type A sorting domain-containing protein [bacterium]